MNGNPKITELPPDKFWCPQLLKALYSLGGSARINEARHKALSFFDMDKEPLEKPTKDGKSTVLFNRMAWARLYLVYAGYIGNEEFGVWTLTDKAKKEISDILKFIDKDISEGIGGYPVPENCTTNTGYFIDNVMRLVIEEANRKKQEREEAASAKTGESADSQAEDGYIDEEATEEEQKLKQKLKEELNKVVGADRSDFVDEGRQLQEELNVIKNISPEQFEHLCAQLLKGLDCYEDVQSTPLSRDGGYDGVGYLVSGLVRFKVIFQAKRYADTPASLPDINAFLGAMDGVRAEKGIFITTSRFTADAIKRAAEVGGKITLINGEDLIWILRKNKIGYTKKTYHVMKREFFTEI